jgi:hypothetical protein
MFNSTNPIHRKISEIVRSAQIDREIEVGCQ